MEIDGAFNEICKKVAEDVEELLKCPKKDDTYVYLMGRIHCGTSAAITIESASGWEFTKRIYTKLGWWNPTSRVANDVAPAESEDL